ncbi:MAG: alpha/beta fold hydrolase [Candidatus Hodarchaeales archaeon]|jgi:pimeloyl-ACP methyl ester carboxylesterase
MLVEKFFDNNGLKINYVALENSGPPLLLLSGFTGTWQGFLNLISPLSLRWSIYALDFRGHGKSDHAGSYNIMDYVEDTINFIDKVIGSDSKAVIFGVSMGGIVANLVASNRPDLVKGIINGDVGLDKNYLIDIFKEPDDFWRTLEQITSMDLTQEKIYQKLSDSMIALPNGEKIRIIDLWTDINAPFMLLAWSQVDSKVIQAWNHDIEIVLKEYIRSEYLPKIKCPMLLINSDQELVNITEEDIREAQKYINPLFFVQLKGVTHALHLEFIDPILRTITPFLEYIR